MLLSLIRSTLRAVRPTGTYELAVQRFAEASGKPPDTSEAEVDRIMDQLRLIDQRAPYWHVPELAAATPANRTELQLTADVLLQHSLNDRQTTDSLLVEMQDAYGPCEQLLQQREEQPVDRHRRRASTSRDPSVRQLAQAHQRYLQAWRRWFDHVHPSGDSVGQEGAE